MPSERLRKLEMDANAAFDQYREMYFEGGVSSVYLWDLVSFLLNFFLELLFPISSVQKCELHCTVVPIVSGFGLCWCDSDKEGRRRIEEDQGLLGLHPRGRSAGEELRAVGALQAHLDLHAVAADQQGRLGHHEPRRLAHPTGTWGEFFVVKPCTDSVRGIIPAIFFSRKFNVLQTDCQMRYK